jgi:hypothetical protein
MQETRSNELSIPIDADFIRLMKPEKEAILILSECNRPAATNSQFRSGGLDFITDPNSKCQIPNRNKLEYFNALKISSKL